MSFEITELEEQVKKEIRKSKERLKEWWDTWEKIYKHIVGFPKEKKQKALFEEIAAANSQLGKIWTSEPVLGVHWKDWCWGWNSNTLDTSCKELTHRKRLWCWEGLGAGGEGDNRGWDCITDSMDLSLSELRELVIDREAWHAAIHGVTKSWTQLRDWTELKMHSVIICYTYTLWENDHNQTNTSIISHSSCVFVVWIFKIILLASFKYTTQYY